MPWIVLFGWIEMCWNAKYSLQNNNWLICKPVKFCGWSISGFCCDCWGVSIIYWLMQIYLENSVKNSSWVGLWIGFPGYCARQSIFWIYNTNVSFGMLSQISVERRTLKAAYPNLSTTHLSVHIWNSSCDFIWMQFRTEHILGIQFECIFGCSILIFGDNNSMETDHCRQIDVVVDRQWHAI